MVQLHKATKQNSRELNAPLNVHRTSHRQNTVPFRLTAQWIERQQPATDVEGDILQMTVDSGRAFAIIAKRKATFSMCAGTDFCRRNTEKAQSSETQHESCSSVTVTERTELTTKLNHHHQSHFHGKLIITGLLSVSIELLSSQYM